VVVVVGCVVVVVGLVVVVVGRVVVVVVGTVVVVVGRVVVVVDIGVVVFDTRREELKSAGVVNSSSGHPLMNRLIHPPTVCGTNLILSVLSCTGNVNRIRALGSVRVSWNTQICPFTL